MKYEPRKYFRKRGYNVILQASIHAEDISIFMVNPEKT